jgi:hypothetical protein
VVGSVQGVLPSFQLPPAPPKYPSEGEHSIEIIAL